MGDVVYICDTCAAPGEAPEGAGFAADLRMAAPVEVEVRTTSCLNMCDAPLALALRGSGKVAYLFSGVRPAEDVADTLALLKLYRDAPDGVIQDARPAGRLRFCLQGRVPPL
ncbi:DUF1636 family protein [Shimia aestuarii]|uniref:Metal-binding protein n=1 Tax=Shimia aestuarii TaxID=254406 RepID=A0A1I4MRX0_9RHOB|nr:DUF1636 family protein [Shimia aestuarii]SFM05810.1 Protein of unknown function [Shimia aestuarii]